MTMTTEESPEATRLTLPPLRIGDSVCDARNPQVRGEVRRVEGGRYFVTWLSGKTWIYPRTALMLVES